MTATRIAPEGGYDFSAKAEFRSFVWDRICSRSPWREPNHHALVMPSLEGIELQEALGRGFRQENMHVVDSSPAVVAILKRRYPEIQTYGVSIERAHARIAEKGVSLYGASIDLCGTASWQTARALFDCSQADVWQSGARVVVNVLRGRESAFTRRAVIDDIGVARLSWFRFFLDGWVDNSIQPTIRDLWRVYTLAVSLPRHVLIPERTRPYVSSNGQSFLTIAFTAYRVRDLLQSLKAGGTRSRLAAKAFASNAALTNLMLFIADDASIDFSDAAYPVWAMNASQDRGDSAVCELLAARINVWDHPVVREFEKKYGKVSPE